uniref:Protein FAM76A n=2 Tax=Nyssomyia neivai TaxID=330878 RepID=A0A1L8DA29_9DIPT
MSAQVVLFACSKCFTRHEFHELSPGQNLCKECRGAFPIVKCTYCRSEFQQSSKGSTSTICKKCEQNVKQYGKPSACEYCNIIAAFIGSKCQRCTNSELKYGPAVTCEQCKQRCAFDRQDDNKKIDGKLLCWLCTLSYKRALAKARQVETERRMAKKRSHNNDKTAQQQIKENNAKKLQRNELNKGSSGIPEIPEKMARVANSGSIDPNSSDHVVAMTQLKETIASLQKKLTMKDKELLQKDKMITELKAQHFTAETELRKQMKDEERMYDSKVDMLNQKVAGLLKEIASLSKTTKRRGNIVKNENSNSQVAKDSGGSGTDSPSTN